MVESRCPDGTFAFFGGKINRVQEAKLKLVSFSNFSIIKRGREEQVEEPSGGASGGRGSFGFGGGAGGGGYGGSSSTSGNKQVRSSTSRSCQACREGVQHYKLHIIIMRVCGRTAHHVAVRTRPLSSTSASLLMLLFVADALIGILFRPSCHLKPQMS